MIYFLSILLFFPALCHSQKLGCSTPKICQHEGILNNQNCTCECQPAYLGGIQLKLSSKWV